MNSCDVMIRLLPGLIDYAFEFDEVPKCQIEQAKSR